MKALNITVDKQIELSPINIGNRLAPHSAWLIMLDKCVRGILLSDPNEPKFYVIYSYDRRIDGDGGPIRFASYASAEKWLAFRLGCNCGEDTINPEDDEEYIKRFSMILPHLEE